jgi:uncharacterized protein YdhG (YjbR/CyaY superfamily)
MATKFESVEEYILSFPPDVQIIMEELRRTIKEAAPQAEEKISYNTPAYLFHGPLIYFSGWKKHIGVYALTSGILDAFKDQVTPYVGEKGSLRFPLDRPMPFSLIRDMVTRRVSEKLRDDAGKSGGYPSRPRTGGICSTLDRSCTRCVRRGGFQTLPCGLCHLPQRERIVSAPFEIGC